MKIIAEKITGISLAREACEFTMLKDFEAKITLDKLYKCEHSPMRTQLFIIRSYGIKSFVAYHFRTHHVGVVDHFITSQRDDRGGIGRESREEPVNYMVIINAKGLIDMARKRLCKQAHKDTKNVMLAIKRAVYKVDPDLAKYMVKECEYRGGICHELKSCNELSEMFIN